MKQGLVTETKQKLEVIADILYRGYVQEGIATMTEVLPNLAEIASDIQGTELQERLLNDSLTPALEAMENQDGTLLADLITYELIDLLDSIG